LVNHFGHIFGNNNNNQMSDESLIETQIRKTAHSLCSVSGLFILANSLSLSISLPPIMLQRRVEKLYIREKSSTMLIEYLSKKENPMGIL
jgi:hypothetical protein